MAMRSTKQTTPYWMLMIIAGATCLTTLACNKKEDPAPPTPGGGAACSVPALEFTSAPGLRMCLDGILISLDADDMEVFNSGMQEAFPGPPAGMRYSSRFYAMNINDFRFGLELGLFVDNGGVPTAEQFIGYCEPGMREHGNTEEELGKASVFWREEGGFPPWSTYCGSADQSDFSFTITHSEPFVEDGEQHVKVRATFSGTVYDCGGGGSKQAAGTVVTVFRREA